MFNKVSYEIGILNCVTGKQVKKKVIEDDTVFREDRDNFIEKILREAKKIASWFDKQDTFFSKSYWQHLEEWDNISKSIKNFIMGKTLGNVIAKSVAVFPRGGSGVEHEFYIKRIEEKRY